MLPLLHRQATTGGLGLARQLSRPWTPHTTTIRCLGSANHEHQQPDGTPIADVVVVGGGMVGAALAALLAANPITCGLRILLADHKAQAFTWTPPPVPELRVSTVTPASIASLQKAGAWDLVLQHSAHFSTMQVWDTAGPGYIRWHAADVGMASIASVAENSLLQAALLAGLKASCEAGGQPLTELAPGGGVTAPLAPGVTCMWPASLESLTLPPSAPGASGAPTNALAQLSFKGGARLAARLVVAADGGASQVRTLAGLRTFGWQYGQRGLVATVELEGGATDTAWQRFLPTGPLALLPVRGGLANIVWSTTPAMAGGLAQLDPTAFAAAVNQALQGSGPGAADASDAAPGWQQGLSSLLKALPTELGGGPGGADPRRDAPLITKWVGTAPKSFPLQLQQSGRFIRPRLALVGDAAHVVHPLAGQGVNLGFGDADALAATLVHACEVGADPGDVLLLQEQYERPRQAAVIAMAAALDGLQRVFGVQASPLAGLRNFGLGMLNALPLKNQIMRVAMGQPMLPGAREPRVLHATLAGSATCNDTPSAPHTTPRYLHSSHLPHMLASALGAAAHSPTPARPGGMVGSRPLMALLLLVALLVGLPWEANAARSPRGWLRPAGECDLAPCVATVHLTPEAAAFLASANGEGTSASGWRRVRRKYAVQRHASHTDARRHARLTGNSFLIHVLLHSRYDSEGWDRLQITVNEFIPLPDSIKAHAAGFAEAFFTQPEIFNYWNNYRRNEFAASGGLPSPELLSFVDSQMAHVRAKVAERRADTKYWRLMGLVMDQFDGLVEGYQQTVMESQYNLTWHDLYLLQSAGDLYDLNALYPPHAVDQGGAVGGRAAAALSTPPAPRYTPGHGTTGGEGYGELLECSALIRVDNGSISPARAGARSSWDAHEAEQRPQQPAGLLARLAAAAARWLGPLGSLLLPGARPHAWMDDARNREHRGVDFFAGHATWRPYYAMRRTWKIMVFPWSQTGPVAISSSPGFLFSKDDWYTTDQFVVMETTLGVYDAKLYDAIQPDCALTWQRAMVATYGAASAEEWTSLFAQENSGTYNNQWMVLDVDALQAGWTTDVLWVLEQLPGYVEKADMTSVLLQQGYWASFNVPYFPNMYNLSGYPASENLLYTAPRARIFAREAPGVSSLHGLQHLLRYNGYDAGDAASEGRPNAAIAARYDLEPVEQNGATFNWTRHPFGAVDAKAVDAKAFRDRKTHVICGPTTQDQPPFAWMASGFDATPHDGVAEAFDFDWQAYAWEDMQLGGAV